MRQQFDDLTFDPDARQLWSDGTEVHLSLKAFELLALLIDRRPHAVSKADLRAHLWPGTFVSDSSLPSLISEIRDAIADHEREPRLIRTVHGFGYSFQGEEAAPAAGTQESAAPTAWLIGAEMEIPLAAGTHVLGREGPGIILLKSSTVSRRHVRIAIAAGGATVEDLGSKNGTYINDRQVKGTMPVVEGDQLRIGSLLFTVRLSAPSHSTETLSSHHRLRS